MPWWPPPTTTPSPSSPSTPTPSSPPSSPPTSTSSSTSTPASTSPPPPTPKRRGRPSKINAIARVDPDGTQHTVAQVICAWLRAGLPYDTVYARAGVSTGTAAQWLRKAAAIEERLAINPAAEATLTLNEQDLRDFARDVEQAKAEGESQMQDLMRALAVGGIPQKITTTTQRDTYDPDGKATGSEITTVTRETRTLPSFHALKWRLETTYQRRPRLDVNITSPGLDDDARDEALADAIEAWLKTQPESTDAIPSSDQQP